MTPKILRLSAAAALIALFIISCGKEKSFETATNGSNMVNGVLQMKIDGQQWVADYVAGASIMNGFINISGISKDKKTFTITLLGAQEGVYDLDPASVEGAAALSDSMAIDPTSYVSVSSDDSAFNGGTVTVTRIDQANKTITGTFSLRLFREKDSTRKIITEGSFNLQFETTLPPGNAGKDTFRVKIDGADWAPNSLISLTIAQTNQINIIANNSTASKTVGLLMPKNITPGTYTLDFYGTTYIGSYNPSATLALASQGNGSLTILEHNTTTRRIRGNFNFTAEEIVPANPSAPVSANLTAGYFSVVYQ